MMTPRQIATEVEAAHYGRAHDTHRIMLARLVVAAEGPNLAVLGRDQLETLRNDLLVQLAAVNLHLERHARLRHPPPEAASIDPST